MSVIFSSTISQYPQAKLNAADYDIVSYLTITQELAHNPVKVCLKAYSDLANGDLIWLVNHIRNPFKELTVGRILRIPDIAMASSVAAVRSSNTQTSVRIRQAEVNGQTIVY